jgi:hypothetical protein
METFINNQSENTATINAEIKLNQSCEVQVIIGSSIFLFPAIINSIINGGQNNITQYAIKFVKEQAFNECFLVKRDQIKVAESIKHNENSSMLANLNKQTDTKKFEINSREKDLLFSTPKIIPSKGKNKTSKSNKRRSSISSNCSSMLTNFSKIHRERRIIKQRVEKNFNYYDNRISKKFQNISNISEKEETGGWKVKDLIAVRDKNTVYKAKILEIKSNQIKIHYMGWNSRFDKWFHNQDQNLKKIEDVSNLEEKKKMKKNK